MPDKPVPMVKALGFTAVIVAEPPRDMAVPLTVTALLVRLLLPMLLSVLLAPLIVLLVSVSVPASVAKVPVVGSVTAVLPVAVKD